MTKSTGADVFDRPEIFLSLAVSLLDQNKVAAAEELIADTLARHPGDPLYENVARIIRTRKLPSWHASMLRDGPRNAAYRAAIEAVAEDRVVLDIGTGSGLLAMMAARAGAKRVIACEANPLVAETARRIIAANGFADVITIHACHSTKLTRDMIGDAGAEVVVSEIFAADLVGEGVLPALEHARQELCAPDALFVPEAACLRVALVELAKMEATPRMVEGFDLGEFLPLYSNTDFIDPASTKFALRSQPVDLALLNWNIPSPVPVTGHAAASVTASGGTINAVAQWLKIDFGNGVAYENPPGGDAAAHWYPITYLLPSSLQTEPGETLEVEAFYHAATLQVWANQARQTSG
ncbi:50S ribosomal protein L11 methyltransferase [Erythrobacter sp. sf7]|uniref:50S ribosomal protein L11 methyltransferase n=1 Tax=Erythrobacter fulvus TaxID=2987523 RepID=A0ABT5JS98_9SPHN|nr:50S ribosomal protein L11 methyltransferase [Erythrobacter fulvus]MDC8755376.1 50S ribosomal protein L11 methyltransferase [Erythrobacter fulvus]